MTCTKYGDSSLTYYDPYLDEVSENNRLTNHPNEKYRTERRLKQVIQAMKDFLKITRALFSTAEQQTIEDEIANYEKYLPK